MAYLAAMAEYNRNINDISDHLSSNMSDASDEYSAFDFSEFTEEDFRQIDADINDQVNNVNGRGGPSLTIELELESLPPITETGRVLSPPNGKQQQTELTPYQEFRPGGVFSVTDLAAPTWWVVAIVEGYLHHTN